MEPTEARGTSDPAGLRIGPAGWSYEDWKGIVYPPGMPSKQHALEFLSPFFDTVEVNATFYRPCEAKHAQAWVRKVEGNERFRFCVKLWQRFTHERGAWPAESEAERFREGIAPLVDAGRLGAVLVQFPWSFKRTPENRRWLARVLDTFAAYPLAVEVRHDSWNRGEVFAGLSERRVAFCNIDQPIFGGSLPPTGEVTAPMAYVRFHGRNKANWFREGAGRDNRYDYLYSLDELRPWIEKIQAIRTKADEVYVITNNHYRGQAVVNAFEIGQALGQTGFTPPPHLVEAYPRLGRPHAS